MMSSLVRAGRVLELFTADRGEWGVSEIARATGLSKATVHELLSTLAHLGVVHRTTGRRYRLGWRILTLAAGINDATRLRQEGSNSVRRLCSATGHAAYLAVWDRRDVVYLSRATGRNAVKVEAGAPGSLLPGYATASGKMLMSSCTWDEITPGLGSMRKLTAATVVNERVLREQVLEAFATGYAISKNEVVKGLSQVAVVVQGTDGTPTAALGVAMPSQQLDECLGATVHQLTQASQILTRNLRGPATTAGV